MRCAVLLLSVVVAASCTPAGPPTREPDISGLITSASVDGMTILVEERPQETAGSAKASVRITSQTKLWGPGGASARAERTALRVGASVRVWFDGPVATSYPVQGSASDVVIDATANGPGLYVISKGAAAVSVTVNGFAAAVVPCNGGAAVRPHADGTPDLPWQVVVTRQLDGRVLLDERVTELPRWLLVQRDVAGIGAKPVSGPFVPCG